MVIDNTLLLLLIVLGLGLIVPEFFKRFRIPLLTVILLAGAIAGPNALNYVHQKARKARQARIKARARHLRDSLDGQILAYEEILRYLKRR